MGHQGLASVLLTAAIVLVHADNSTSPAADVVPQTMCERCGRSADQTSRDSPCWYASSASNNEFVQHKFCGAQPVGSGTQYACCPVRSKGLSYDCSREFGRCSCVGAGCPSTTSYTPYRETHNGDSALAGIIPLILICSIIACCVSYRRNQQQMYMQQELQAMPGFHPNAPGYGQQTGGYGGYPPMAQPVYQQNQGMGAGTAAALGAGGGFLGGMMLANAMDGGHHHDGGYASGAPPPQDMGGGGGGDIGADMGFGE